MTKLFGNIIAAGILQTCVWSVEKLILLGTDRVASQLKNLSESLDLTNTMLNLF